MRLTHKEMMMTLSKRINDLRFRGDISQDEWRSIELDAKQLETENGVLADGLLEYAEWARDQTPLNDAAITLDAWLDGEQSAN